MDTAVMFSKKTDEWRTPESLYNQLNAEFGFDVDAAATTENAYQEMYFGPDRLNPAHRDALAVENWAAYGKVFWLNPPYSKCREFLTKASKESREHGVTVVCLVPARTDTRWFHEVVWDREMHRPERGVEVRFLKGRLTFEGASAGAPFPRWRPQPLRAFQARLLPA